MMIFTHSIIAALMLVGLTQPLYARSGHKGEQDEVFKGTQGGGVRSLRSIENAVVPGMKSQGADYIGQEYDGDLNRYRLKFLRGSSVIWVDVDGRTGAITGRAGG